MLGKDAAQVCTCSAASRSDRGYSAAASNDREGLSAMLDSVQQVSEPFGGISCADFAHDLIIRFVAAKSMPTAMSIAAPAPFD
jgi:hypothetical protein